TWFSTYSFFFNDSPPTDIFSLSLHDALPISRYSQLRQFFEAELQRLSDQGQQRQAEILAKLEQLDRDLRVTIEQSGNTVAAYIRSEEHTSELQSRFDLVCRLLLEKKKTSQT